MDKLEQHRSNWGTSEFLRHLSATSFKMNLFFYYLLKPLIPRRLQLFLRRCRGRQIISKVNTSWPINPAASKKPENWQGWPDGKKFALVLTHDVEKILGTTRVLPLLELEKNLGFRSCFNFVGADYPVPDNLIETIRTEGFEIGVHGLHHNGFMYASRRIFKKHARGIRRLLKKWNARGFRSPSMHRNLAWIHALGIAYDSSTFDTDPFEPQPDGVKTIFPFWIPHRDNTTGYIELPYTLPQDFTTFILLEEKNIDIWKRKLDWIAEHGGMALLNTHPDYMSWDASLLGNEEYSVEYYKEFLEYVRDKYEGEYWHATPGAVSEYCGNVLKNMEPMPDNSLCKRNLHVCMPTYSFYESDNRVKRYAESLAQTGNTVDIFCLRNEEQPAFEIMEGVRVHRIQKREKNEKSKWTYFARLTLFLLKSTIGVSLSHCKKRYDLVHVHNIPDFEVFSAILPKITGSKIILDIHDVIPELFCSKFVGAQDSLWFRMLCLQERLATSFVDHIIISNSIWGKRIEERSSASDKCSILINYPDTAVFKREKYSKNGNRGFIIYPGSLNVHQGVDIALEAFSSIKDNIPDIDFHIYGNGPALNSLKELAVRLGIRDRVVFKDALPIKEIAAIMARAKCGVVPKRADLFGNEAFSTKVLEFMSLSVPIVLSSTAIDKHYFNDSQVLFFRPGDKKDLAEKLLLLLTDEELREKLIHNSLEFVRENNWDQKKHIYFSIINSLMKEKNSLKTSYNTNTYSS